MHEEIDKLQRSLRENLTQHIQQPEIDSEIISNWAFMLKYYEKLRGLIRITSICQYHSRMQIDHGM